MPIPLELPVFETDHLVLRAVEPEDWETFAAHEGDFTSVRAGAGWVPVPWSAQRVRTWTAEPERSVVQDDLFTWAVAAKGGNQVLGTINSHHTDPRVGCFSYGIAVFPDHRRRRVASAAIGLLLGFFFGEARYQKCNVTVYSFNDASLALHRRLGFVEEGVRRRTVYTAGSHHDEVLFGLTAEEFAEAFPR